LAARGYNQAWELARHLAQSLGQPPSSKDRSWLNRQRRLEAWPQALLRPLDTAHQADLDRQQRQANLRAAFVVHPRWRSRLQGLHVALVDDVMTTGATLRECSLSLLQAGVSRVDLWVLARTPQPV
jgi:predicted amidophosphoribosyltransferase